MKKVKVFLNILFNSAIPWPSYYSKILHMQFINSLKYLLTLIVILNIIFIASIYSKLNYGKIHSIISAFLVSAKQIPNDFRLQIANGTLITNNNRPYFFWIDYQNKKKLVGVVDESATPDKINKYESMFLLTSRDFVTLGSTKTISLSSLGPLTINHKIIQKSVINLNAILKFLPIIYMCIIIVLSIVVPIFSIVITVVYLFVASFIGYYAYRIFTKKHIKYKKTIQIAFHAATLPLIVDYFIIVFKPTLPFKPFIVMPQSFFPILFIFLLSLFIFTGIYEAHSNRKHDTMSA